jgi:HD superfamily phosphohydrolase
MQEEIMYILDPLYGVIDFDKIIYKCMLTPEVQRLREVRLCNINSLFITGSSNISRFEHSIGTAYLAKINVESNSEYFTNNDREAFVLAALLHDIANGPFGHSYEYIMERKGFVPEKGIADVIRKTDDGTYKKNAKLEPIYFGKMNAIINILTEIQLSTIEAIVSGGHQFSKLISDIIDLDNIDNVFRMAHHMGLPFNRDAPLLLAKSIKCINNQVVFSQEAEPFILEWYTLREQVYRFLLTNPQEFSAKYMLTEAMDIMFEYFSVKDHKDISSNIKEIKWNFTDYELMLSLLSLHEIWLKRKILINEELNYQNLIKHLEDREKLINFLATNNINLSKYFKISNIKKDETINLLDKNQSFIINNSGFYKEVKVQYNVSQIISRLMTGDLYDCLIIIRTKDIDKYKNFLNYERRIVIENDLANNLKKEFGLGQSIKIGIHPILDVNKTRRKIETIIIEKNRPFTVGESSNYLLIGVFLKNTQYGYANIKHMSLKNRDTVTNGALLFFKEYFAYEVDFIPLYEEVNYFE